MNLKIFFIVVLSFVIGMNWGMAQTATAPHTVASTSDYIIPHAIPDESMTFSLQDTGVYKPITWGLDLAWLSEVNIRRGIAYMGKEQVDIIRSSFTPTAALIADTLPQDELDELNERIGIIKQWVGPVDIALNSDHPSVDDYFYGNAENWAKLIEVTAKIHADSGLNVVTVSPFNEPDVTSTGQGSLADFDAINQVLKNNTYFDNIRVSGGNTCNDDYALEYYNTLKDYLDEGNTHQLAGSFKNYAEFYEAVRANGHHATNDELHNVMEAMVGVEYGLQTGIWWGTAEFARGEFVKASDGRRLAYAENRSNWTAASVYRSPNGQVQAFGGASERQASTTSYRFISTDEPVFFDGHGPQQEYVLTIPGGNGYGNMQPNAERVVQITKGEDIQPVISGNYLLVNRASGMVLQMPEGNTTEGTRALQGTNSGLLEQQWQVMPVDSTIGGDFSYYSIQNRANSLMLDLYNYDLEEDGNIIQWSSTEGSNQQWLLEYTADGWFTIRNKYSALYLDIADTENGAYVIQKGKTAGSSQQWRFLAVDVNIDFEAPGAPQNLQASSQPASIRLDWTANAEDDLKSYTIYRSNTEEKGYTTLARHVHSAAFVDNTVQTGSNYFYKIKAVDASLNHSAYSGIVQAASSGKDTLIAHLQFEENTSDSSANLNHGKSLQTAEYTSGKIGSKALKLDGTQNFLKLSSSLANTQNITVSCWVCWNGYLTEEYIFDFGNNASERFYLSPNIDLSHLELGICQEQQSHTIQTNALTLGEWTHVAATLNDTLMCLYINGSLSGTTGINIHTSDFKPILNYIGRGQQSEKLLNAYLDDFRVYNYALNAEQVGEVFNDLGTNTSAKVKEATKELQIYPNPATEQINLTLKGEKILGAEIRNSSGQLIEVYTNTSTISISHLPAGMYYLSAKSKTNQLYQQKFVKE